MTTRADAEIPLAAAVAVSSDNRQALVERGEKISGKSEDLADAATDFLHTAKALRRQAEERSGWLPF
ncbi:hypothetical protein EMIHUDRAFT_371571 [Emiliania huxleyi CCMP1516]|uniref:V-SNARE coiled-coil homology domain-containing protein n=2 Tax=Emiliania huxleyi TaxID=2903 RepID=A0A0D3IIW3_EMIH1|nr:hypothetical protein EMIHUDRAFT_371571 [Emiliania huxleyi CCMP1516]EOD11198.1 hypothetical protein EMIHUDRAFT_371571 [Emiliania huxleyi CCMP1516]|eukprot:XP_005763627.1 hypothetical protein EMIHUDRAFT_371571 [Emiliania huxleyi CCMP1516]